jgi:hypothetical protein
VRPGALIAARGHRLVVFDASSMRELDLVRPDAPATVTKLDHRERVLNADLGPDSPDGVSILFATAERVYLRAPGAPAKPIAEVEKVHSLSFSPDGAAQLWLADWGASAVAQGGKQWPFPDGTASARFRVDGGKGLVFTTDDGVFTWDPAGGGAPKEVGGISTDDGGNIAGDVVGGAVISFEYKKPGWLKEVQQPKFPLQ